MTAATSGARPRSSRRTICPFDLNTSVAQFRTTSFPVITNDGDDFQVFWAARNFAPEASDNTCMNGAARIVMSTSATGNNWSAPAAIDPVNDGEPGASPDAHQFMPSAATARGHTQVIWYDTRFDKANDGSGMTCDSFDCRAESLSSAHRRRARLQIVNGAVPDNSVQVSRYQVGFANVNPGAPGLARDAGPAGEQLHQHAAVCQRSDPVCRRLYLGHGRGLSASTATVTGSRTTRPSLAISIRVSFLAAWADNRNVRGNVWGDISNGHANTLFIDGGAIAERDRQYRPPALSCRAAGSPAPGRPMSTAR